MGETLGGVAIVLGILAVAALATHFYAKCAYIRCDSCGALNARRRTRCRSCDAAIQ